MPKLPGLGRKEARRGRPPRRRSRLIMLIRSILSGVFMTAGFLLVLWAIGELFVRLIDGSGGGTYIDWGMVPIILALSSLPCFILYMIINYDRIGWIQLVLSKFRKEKAPKEIETVELD